MSNQTLCTCGCCGEHDNLTPLNIENTPGLSALLYRVGTHGSFKESMLHALATKPALKKLTSRYDDDFSIATIDAWSTVLDVLTFYQERIINEGYLNTATERLSVLELARHINYVPRPGVAAGTFLCFMMNDAVGAPLKAKIPVGTKVQSVPEQYQQPQIFETTEEIEARVEWNSIPLQTKRKLIPVFGDTHIYLKGINTGLQSGDTILMIGQEREKDVKSNRWDCRKVIQVIPDSIADHTKIIWDRGLGKSTNTRKSFPANAGFKFYALRQKAPLFGYNAPDWRVMPKEITDRFLKPSIETKDANSPPEWEGLSIKSISKKDDMIHLDGIHPKATKGSWIVVSTDSYEEVYKIIETEESSQKDFTLASKTTRLKLSGENLEKKFDKSVREITVFFQSEELEIAAHPVNDGIKDDQEITLSKLMNGLTPGKPVFITGKRSRLVIPENKNEKYNFIVATDPAKNRKLKKGESLIIISNPVQVSAATFRCNLKDDAGTEGYIDVANYEFQPVASRPDDSFVSELHIIDRVKNNQDPTAFFTKDRVANYFDLLTVTVQANVAAATHGETKTEVLGSGNGSALFQKFELKQKPLTFTSAATASGSQTTLQIRVNDILWHEAATFYGSGPDDKIYTTHINEEGKVTVMFGDGITGSRLPTGTENVKATYRVGIGTEALLNAGQLSMLLTPQLGVNKVNNPLPTNGAEDPESIDNARKNAPLTVLTLDRIVSAKDFEDFTAAFAGISKAKAEVLWSGEQKIVYITIATEDQKPFDQSASFYQNLVAAVRDAGHSNNTIFIENFAAKYFTLAAKIKVHPDFIAEDVKQKVIQKLTNAFSFAARSFGQQITPSEVMAVIQSVDGVIYTDIDQLNGLNPFATKHFRIPARLAVWQSGKILPAELLMINEKEIQITLL